MIDISRFMQDGVGVKTEEYEISILTGVGTFEANGKIVAVFGYVTSTTADDNWLGIAKYIFPTVSSTPVTLLNGVYGADISLTLTDAYTLTYDANVLLPNNAVVISEKG